MIYERLANILVTEIDTLEIGVNVFVNQAPYDAEFMAIFKDVPGGIAIDGYMPTERRGNFQLAFRGKSQSQIYNAMKDAMNALTINGASYPDYIIKNCRPTTEPISYQLSIGNLREISVNFSINYGIVP